MATVRTGQLEQAGREARPWVQRGARLGALSRGVIYLVLGGLALQAAFGSRGEPPGPGGVFDVIVRQPLGRPLLGLLATGLAGYALWDFARAVLDPYRPSRGAAHILQRVGWGMGGVISMALAVTALQSAVNVGHVAGDDQQARGWTAAILAAPLGSWIIAVTGIIIIAVGAVFLWQAWRADLDADLGSTPLAPRTRQWILHFGRFGMVARGIVLTLIGIFLLVAVVDANPEEARGVAGALAVLRQQPYGRWVLGAIAAGFMSYGLYELLRARYSRFTLV